MIPNCETGEGDPLEAIIRDVATRHGIVLGRDDPILIIHTINRRIMETSAEVQRTLLEEHSSVLVALADDARKQTIQGINVVMREASAGILAAMRQEALRMFNDQRMESRAAAQAMTAEFLRWRRIATFSFCLSLLMVGATGGILLSIAG